MPAAQRASTLCGLAALLAVLAYANALHNPFVYDDYHTVVANTSLVHVGDLRAIVLHDVTRPLVNFSYAADRALWGPTPVGFHVTNVLLHAMAVVLLFQIAVRLLAGAGALAGAFTAAALLAVHPMMTEAVGYVSGRSEVLCLVVMLAGLWTARRWMAGGSARWAAATAALWVVALTAKETVAMFPFALAACDWLTAGDAAGARRRTLRLYAPMAAVAVAAGIGRIAILRFEYASVSFHGSYILVELDVLRRYLTLLAAPVRQTIFHEVSAVPLVSIPGAVALALGAALVWLVWAIRRAEPIAAFGIAWFLLMLVPSAALAVLDQGEPMAEHRVYIASAGLFLAAGAGVRWLSVRVATDRAAIRRAGAVALAVILVSLLAKTIVRNAIWSDPVTLWEESVSLAPDHYRPRLLLGEALEDSGDKVGALEQFREAVRLRPTDVTSYLKLGLCLVDLGRIEEARHAFEQAVAVDPANEPARESLALLAGVTTVK
jgi:hypothetical protein